MKRFILTGTPGCGKTTVLREFERRGYPVVEEAATDVIADEQRRGNSEAWREPAFIETIAGLQQQRMEQPPSRPGDIQFHDRSLICTYALARHLGFAIPLSLDRAIRSMIARRVFDPRVFFLENLGFVTPTQARRITFEDSLVFESIHWEAYRSFGIDCIAIPRGPVSERVDAILAIASRASG
jgi:predicted ATPase